MTMMPEKPLMNRDHLREVVDIALWAGQMSLQNGAETQVVEETVHRIGTGLGAAWLDVLVSPNALIASTISGEEFRTKVRRVPYLGVNLAVLDALDALTRKVSAGEVDAAATRTELVRISSLPSGYNRWIIILMVGTACAAMSRLAGGDEVTLAVTFGAAAAGMWVRQEMTRRHFNPLFTVIIVSFVAGCIASVISVFDLSESATFALSSAVLLNVPGVHLINATQDMLKGQVVTGLMRAVLGALISLCIALGLILAMQLMGARGL
jgi:uncharacterized membrane protein YjjP (DUF1212 family)